MRSSLILALGVIVLETTTPRGAQARDLTDKELLQSGQMPQLRAASGPRSSPFEPPEANDHAFVTDSGSKLDTGCIYRSSGPITFDIPIDRYVGDVDGQGYLTNASSLISNGVISKEAILSMPAFDVDFDANVPPDQPERDQILFNGEVIPPTAAGPFLKGSNNEWRLNTYKLPIEKLRFPNKGTAGNKPTAAINTITINIDTANSGELWCTAIDWGALQFQALSPIVMIHGNNSSGAFFDDRGFKDKLDDLHIPSDNSLNMDTDSIARHVTQYLQSGIPNIARSFGTDSIHIVAHSKGGLDTRAYLATTQYNALRSSKQLEILSLTTLDTPHRGSVGADLVMAQQRELIIHNAVGTGFITRFFVDEDAGTPDLTTYGTAAFNQTNVPGLPPLTRYFATSADADINGNGEIDSTPDEFQGAREESGGEITQFKANAAYQFFKDYGSVTVEVKTITLPIVGQIGTYEVATANAGGGLNDFLVTIDSAKFQAPFQHIKSFTGSEGRDHASIGDSGVAEVVLPFIENTEKTIGDFQ